MSYFVKNPFPNQAQINQEYNIGGWAEISRKRDINTSGRNSGPSGDAARLDYIHRYLNRELYLSEGEHTHATDSLSGPQNKIKSNSEVTISPISKAIEFKNI